MKSSSLMVFSIIKNVEKFLESNKDVNIFKEQSIVWYSNNPDFIKNICKRIYNEIENHFYSYYDFAIYLLYNAIFYGKTEIKLINHKDINKASELFTNEQLRRDEQFILDLNDVLKFDIADYFKINRNGGCILYDDIVMKKRVSPLFYMEYSEHVETENREQNEELKQFIKVTNKIREILKIKEKVKNG